MLTTVTVDVGTTSVKLGVFDSRGEHVRSVRRATPTHRDAWGEAYDTSALIELVRRFVSDLDDGLRGRVERIAITGVGESGGLVRSDLSLASPMILWHDHRGADYLENLSESDRSELFCITGLPVNANYALSKVRWAVDHAAGAAADASWLNIAEYLAAVMTGERWAEPSLASRTMALDLRLQEWSSRAAGLLGVDVSVFPPLRSARDGLSVSPVFAAETGLAETTRVHVAGHDHMVGAVGADLRPGELLNSTGTTEGLLLLADSPAADERSAASKLAGGIAPTAEGYTRFASIPTGGSAFATLQTLLGMGADELSIVIDELAAAYLADDLDLDSAPLVVPQFRGSPPPEKCAKARGIVAGIHGTATAEQVVLGCFLGMTRQFAEVLALFDTRPDRIKVIGPASGNALWLHLKADYLGMPLTVSRAGEVVSRGAQALASDERLPWEACTPFDVEVDPARHKRLRTWGERTHPLWSYLKAAPW